MTIEQMKTYIRKKYKGWKALDYMDAGQIRAIYFKVLEEETK